MNSQRGGARPCLCGGDVLTRPQIWMGKWSQRSGSFTTATLPPLIYTLPGTWSSCILSMGWLEWVPPFTHLRCLAVLYIDDRGENFWFLKASTSFLGIKFIYLRILSLVCFCFVEKPIRIQLLHSRRSSRVDSGDSRSFVTIFPSMLK